MDASFELEERIKGKTVDECQPSGSCLKTLIQEVSTMINNKSDALNTVPDKLLLLQALNELDRVVGMNRLKDTVALQVKHLIGMKKFDISSNDKKLSVIFYGPPGTGKSSVGRIYAKILFSLGYLKKDAKIQKQRELSKSESDTMGTAILILFLLGYVFSMIHSYLSIYLVYVILVIITLLFVYIVYKSFQKGTKLVNVNAMPEMPRDNSKPDELFKVVSRHDLVAGYVGQTAPRTIKVLEENRGKVLFIDEAYSLCRDPRDPYGKECLDTLTYFLTENPDYVVMLAGYKKEMMQLFRFQKGLPRRCMFIMECDPYNGKELYEIFRRQMSKDGFNSRYDHDIRLFFEENEKSFVNYGGDTERLLYYSQLYFSNDNYKNAKAEKKLTLEQIKKGFKDLMINNNNAQLEDAEENESDLNRLVSLMKNK